MNFLTLLVVLVLLITLVSRAVTIKGSRHDYGSSRRIPLSPSPHPAILGDMSNEWAGYCYLCGCVTQSRSLLAQLYYILTYD